MIVNFSDDPDNEDVDPDEVVKSGTKAWERLKREVHWGDWMVVGQAMQIGRERAMKNAGTDKPEGSKYNRFFSEWLAANKLDEIDQATRSRLFSIIDNWDAVWKWRERLTLTERLSLNHPNAVWRKYKKAFAEPAKAKAKAKPTLRDSVTELSEEVADKDGEIARLNEHIAELEAARNHDADADDKPKGVPDEFERWLCLH